MMRGSRLGGALIALIIGISVLTLTLPARGAPEVPTPEPVFRSLRTDYVKTWYIFSDKNPAGVDGVLKPGDQYIAQFKNWWTPVSAHTQHNYQRRTDTLAQDWSSAPVAHASYTDPTKNYWLEREDNAIQFYMTYSQFDNNDWKGGYDYGQTGDVLDILKDRNEDRNGWSLGWLTHDISAGDKTTVAGNVTMDVFVHRHTTTVNLGALGMSYSNPQVATSNDINNTALDNVSSTDQWHPPQFDDTGAPGTGDYDWGGATENQLRMTLNGHTQVEFDAMVASMEAREYDPDALGAGDVIWANRRPTEIKTNITEHDGDPYVYEDAFKDRSTYHEGATDGGVVSGLAGQTDYTPGDPNWDEQQVIRIDFDPATFAAGGITKIVFWDFGEFAGSGQINPHPIVLDLTDTTLFPENRFYIAIVDIPEPAAILLMLSGMGVLLGRRRRRRQLAA